MDDGGWLSFGVLLGFGSFLGTSALGLFFGYLMLQEHERKKRDRSAPGEDPDDKS